MQDEAKNSGPSKRTDSNAARVQFVPAAMPRLLTEGEVAEILRLSVKTLRNWRVSGGPLPHVKISRAVRYQQDDVVRLIAQQRRTSTSDTAGTP
jgi:hypothetical protein